MNLITKAYYKPDKTELKEALKTTFFAYLEEDRRAWDEHLKDCKNSPVIEPNRTWERAIRANERRWGFQFALEKLGVCFEYDEKEDRILGIKHFGVLEELK